MSTTGNQIYQIKASFQINPKTWPNLGINELIEISSNQSPSSTCTNLGGSGGMGGKPLVTSSLNRGASSSLLSTSTMSSASSSATAATISANQFNPVTGSVSNTSASLDDDNTSPFLVHVAQSSFNETILSDTICIDKAANAMPFCIKALSYVYATVVERDVKTLFC
jgi:hypothetical protein